MSDERETRPEGTPPGGSGDLGGKEQTGDGGKSGGPAAGQQPTRDPNAEGQGKRQKVTEED